MTPDRLHAHVTAQALALLAGDDASRVLAALRREVRAGRCELTRRGFLSTLAVATAGMAVDPEQLLWTPTPTVAVAAPKLAFHRDAFSMVMEPLDLSRVLRLIRRRLAQQMAQPINRSYADQFAMADRVVVRGVTRSVTYDVGRYAESTKAPDGERVVAAPAQQVWRVREATARAATSAGTRPRPGATR